MIRNFRTTSRGGRWARSILSQEDPGKGFPADVLRIARRKLVMLDDAETLNDLAKLPGNRLEPLKGNRAGQHSIRINDQWRVCFVWTGKDADAVEITDYH